MNKKSLPMVGIAIGIIVIGVVVVTLSNQGVIPELLDEDNEVHDAVWSGPVGVTQYKHKLGENVYLLIRGIQPHEKGAIGVFTPEGILYKSFEYDGSEKADFNQYFFPDTFAELKICTPDQLVGIWTVVFADNSYPPLEFEMTDEWIRSGEATIFTEC